MSGLRDIPVHVEGTPEAPLTHNALPVLHEIRHALARLIEQGEPIVIDLVALPFGPGDEAQLLAALGEGEVYATLDALGETRIHETAFSGVWVVDHHNAEGERIAFHIEVARLPAILQAQDADLHDGLARLTQTLDVTPEGQH